MDRYNGSEAGFLVSDENDLLVVGVFARTEYRHGASSLRGATSGAINYFLIK
jgi:hypothetical protein